MSTRKKNEGFFIVLAVITVLVTAIYYFSRPNIAVNEAVGEASLVTTVILVGAYYIVDFYQKKGKKVEKQSKGNKKINNR